MSDNLPAVYDVQSLEVMAKQVANSRLFGLDPAQAFTLMLLAQSKGLHPIQAVTVYPQRIVDSPEFGRARTLDRAQKTLRNFLNKIAFAPSGCWNWTGAKLEAGYGKFSVKATNGNGNRPASFAHRISYMVFTGPIPDGLTIDHLCKNKSCVNPFHLEAVTHLVNLIRSGNRVGKHSYTSHCDYGHERTPENTYVTPSGKYKMCRLCMKESDRRRQARRKAAAAIQGGAR